MRTYEWRVNPTAAGPSSSYPNAGSPTFCWPKPTANDLWIRVVPSVVLLRVIQTMFLHGPWPPQPMHPSPLTHCTFPSHATLPL
jgi:hypothetical protein